MSDLIGLVIEVLRELSRKRVIPADIAGLPLAASTVIDDLGMDSLGKLNLLSDLEERADVMIGEGALAGLVTLGDLATLLAGLRAK